jgi:outer membrane murein-binding lipoprotein Lpp
MSAGTQSGRDAGGRVVRKSCVLACALLVALLVAAGCVSDAAKKQWADAMKDLRGDNMEMGSRDKQTP